MRIHYLQHLPFEDAANIAVWADRHGHSQTHTRQFAHDSLPGIDQFDWLIILGGYMGVGDEQQYPWLIHEKRLIEQAIHAGKRVLGICLGAQLIASVLGARVYQHTSREIGWFDVHLTEDGRKSPLFGVLPPTFTAFHWHGDTFDVPADATLTVTNDGCAHQAFTWGTTVAAVQFHVESTPRSVQALVEQCAGELTDEPLVQTPEQILRTDQPYATMQGYMDTLLDAMECVQPSTTVPKEQDTRDAG